MLSSIRFVFYVAFVIFSISFTLAWDFSEFGACSQQQCLLNGVGSSGCADNECLCNNKSWLESTARCTYRECGTAELQTTAGTFYTSCESENTPMVITQEELINAANPSSPNNNGLSTGEILAIVIPSVIAIPPGIVSLLELLRKCGCVKFSAWKWVKNGFRKPRGIRDLCGILPR